MFPFFDTETFEEKIDKTNVVVKVIFDTYKPDIFNFDIQLLELINSKELTDALQLPEEVRKKIKKVQRYEIFFRKKLYKKMKSGILLDKDYKRFKKYGAKVLAQTVFHNIKEMPGIIADQNTVLVKIYIVNKYIEGNLAAHLGEKSTTSKIVLELSGSALTGRAYAPGIWTKKPDISFFDKLLAHELQHHLEHLRGLYKQEDEIQARMKQFMKLNPTEWSAGFPILFELLCNLYTEGIASFRERRRSKYVIFDKDHAEKLVKALEKIANAKDPEEASNITENEFRPHSGTGEYYLGHLMCYFIGLRTMKKNRTDGMIEVAAPKKTKIKFEQLNEFLLTNKNAKIEQLDTKTYEETYAMLSTIKHHTIFLKEYAKACDELGLKKPVMFFDIDFYKKLIAKATKKYKEVPIATEVKSADAGEKFINPGQITSSMEKTDYGKVGLKCGIEIHQRLDTNKLFCNCPSALREDKPDIIVTRQLRAVAGETGMIDVAAKHEMEKGKYFVYEAYSDTTCLVELDEEPPHTMNEEALRTVLQVCKMVNASVVDEVQVMRKNVVNGSNTTGFQRTALVALNGSIDVDGKKIGIPTISIEEEAAKDITKGIDKDGKAFVTYRLDRLGIPLIEIGTDPDITTPEQCKDVAEKIGMILRSTGKVARGLGTIRQDVNVSVKDGTRIEIKGAQDLKMLPTLVEYEATRQLSLLAMKDELENRKPALDKIKTKDATQIFKDTACKFVNSAIAKGAIAQAFTLPGFAGLLGKEVQPGKRLGTELSDYAKSKTGIGGIIHSDEDLKKYNFSEKEIETLKKELEVKDEAFIIIVAEKKLAEDAMKHVIDRAKSALIGVTKEVRRANPDGTTTYMRPMPGAARMYPETDIPPIKPNLKGIEVAELLTDKKERFKEKHNLAEDLARDLSKSGKHELFERFAEEFPDVKPAFIAETMISTPKNLKRKFDVDASAIKDSDFEKIFSLLNSGKITKDSIEEILVAICKGEKVNYERYAPLGDKELENEIQKVIKEGKELEFNALVGKAMGTLKGRADGKKIIEMLKRLKS